jgi:hypothetical protein
MKPRESNNTNKEKHFRHQNSKDMEWTTGQCCISSHYKNLQEQVGKYWSNQEIMYDDFKSKIMDGNVAENYDNEKEESSVEVSCSGACSGKLL